MNTVAYQERLNNKKHIGIRDWGVFKILEVDTEKVRFRGQIWRDLSCFYKRKFENLLVIEAGAEQAVKIRYV
jgi:hypothetical protein